MKFELYKRKSDKISIKDSQRKYTVRPIYKKEIPNVVAIKDSEDKKETFSEEEIEFIKELFGHKDEVLKMFGKKKSVEKDEENTDEEEIIEKEEEVNKSSKDEDNGILFEETAVETETEDDDEEDCFTGDDLNVGDSSIETFENNIESLEQKDNYSKTIEGWNKYYSKYQK